jgi:transcriptional regulator with XRE-family HTH domain
MSTALAQLVRRKRDERHLNVRQAADAWGLSPSTIARLEANAEQQPTLTTLVQLARAFTIPLWCLIDRHGIDLNLPNQLDPEFARWDTLAQSSDDTRRLMQVWPDLAPQQRRGVLAYLETVRQMGQGGVL